jgi:N-methylhydantoinase A/oxoprolinase/acetone carboxylase beta subunit
MPISSLVGWMLLPSSGSAIAPDKDAARAAILARAGELLGFDTDTAAARIFRLTNTNLAAAIRVSLFEKGLDPRDFTLLSFRRYRPLSAPAWSRHSSI